MLAFVKAVSYLGGPKTRFYNHLTGLGLDTVAESRQNEKFCKDYKYDGFRKDFQRKTPHLIFF